MSLQVEKFVTGSYKQNCYIVGNTLGNALVVDPGSDADGISAILNENGWCPLAIIATHAHFDHVGAAADLMDRYNIPFYLDDRDSRLLESINLYKMIVDGSGALRIPEVTNNLANIDSYFEIGPFKINFISTPGHTPGGVCFIIDHHIFTGDTVLPAGVGRIDLPGGDAEEMVKSLALLAKLPGDLLSYPGHGPVIPFDELLHTAKSIGFHPQ